MKLTSDIQSLSTFKRDTAKIRRHLKKTGQPVVLTVNGKAELVVQDIAGYEKLLEAQEPVEAIEGIDRGLDSMKRNAGKPAEKFFKEFFAEKDISDNERSEKRRRVKPPSSETQGVLRALRRAARNALELGIRTGTPVYIMRNNKIVDLTKEQPATKKSRPRRTSSKISSK